MKEKNSIYSARASSNQTLKTFWYDRQGLCAQAPWILTFFPLKQRVYYTFEDGPVYLVYPVHSFLCISSSASLTYSSVRHRHAQAVSRYSVVSSPRANPTIISLQTHFRILSHHINPIIITACLKTVSLCVCVSDPKSPPPSHLKIANNLKFKCLESKPPPLNAKFRPPHPTNYLIQVFCRISAFPIDVDERRYPHVVHYSLFRILSS